MPRRGKLLLASLTVVATSVAWLPGAAAQQAGAGHAAFVGTVTLPTMPCTVSACTATISGGQAVVQAAGLDGPVPWVVTAVANRAGAVSGSFEYLTSSASDLCLSMTGGPGTGSIAIVADDDEGDVVLGLYDGDPIEAVEVEYTFPWGPTLLGLLEASVSVTVTAAGTPHAVVDGDVPQVGTLALGPVLIVPAQPLASPCLSSAGTTPVAGELPFTETPLSPRGGGEASKTPRPPRLEPQAHLGRGRRTAAGFARRGRARVVNVRPGGGQRSLPGATASRAIGPGTRHVRSGPGAITATNATAVTRPFN